MQNIAKTLMSGFKALVNKKIRSSVADWNQNDSSADDYVKNRTHWEERKYQKTLLLDSIEHEFVSLGFEDALHLDSLGLVEGQTYTVSWDGKLYNCVAYIAEEPGTPSLGNDIIGEAGGTGGNGEPFFITDFDGCLIFAGEVGVHTVEITCVENTTVVHKLDKKYLPDGVSFGVDWNQNDETAPDYIKNKTHYSENLYGVILSNTVETNAWGDLWACFDIETTFVPEVGQEYTVIWDGDSYTVTCFEEEGGRFLGDEDAGYGDLLDLPFQLFFFFDGTMMVLASSEGTHTYEVLGTHEIVHKLDYVYLPDIVKDLQSVVHIDDGDIYIGTPEESNKLATESFFYEPKKHLVVKDEVNGYNYFVTTRNGNLVSYIQTQSIEIITMPIKTTYANGEKFNPAGMVVIATGVDGSTREITNYKYDLVTTENANNFYIRLEEGTNVFTAKVNNLTVHDFSLEDFEYIANEDGTYELTAWKGTYNGEPSTRIVIPNSELIIV